MSGGCLGPNYNPTPPRIWSRVQTPCVYSQPDASTVYVPINVYSDTGTAGLTMSSAEYATYYQPMVAKGNILQYKANSSNLTKNQRYAKIARGQWTNRTKTWATQSQTYTNPNSASLARVGGVTIPTPKGYQSPWGCSSNVVQNGGNLIGTTTVNPCTGDVIAVSANQTCNLSTDCDVPGVPVALCWNDKIQTWYPRQRLTMPTSGNKFPVGYKFLRSANSIVPVNKDGVGSY